MIAHLLGRAWVRPTLRLLPWAALGLAVGSGAIVGALWRSSGRHGPDLLWAPIAAAVAVAVARVLADPAHQLLAPVPCSRPARLGARLLLFLPVALAAWLVVGPLVATEQIGQVASVGRVTALASVGLAAGCSVERRLPEIAPLVGATVATGLATAWLLVGDRRGAGLVDWWVTRPWVAVAAAGVVCWVALRQAG